MTNQGVETAEIQLRDAEVTLEIPQAPEIIARVAAQAEALVDFRVVLPSNSIGPEDEQGLLVEVVSQPAAIALRDAIQATFPDSTPPPAVTLLASVVVKGTRSGNTSGKIGIVESRVFTFPITLCEGCLLSCSSCPGGACPETTSYVGGICGNAQDIPLSPLECTGSSGAQ